MSFTSPRSLWILTSLIVACGEPGGASPLDDLAGAAGTSNQQSPPPGDGGTGGGGSVDTEFDASRVVDFPAGVTVASPVSARGPAPTGGGFAGGPRLRLSVAPPPGPAPAGGQSYAEVVSAISDVLGGTATAGDQFQLGAFFTRAGNANCYGPSMRWQNHPDASGGDSAEGQLPGGDLGLWTASTESGEACAAAQLNARMRDLQSQVGMGLMALAALVSAYEDTGASWPDDIAPGAVVDVTAELGAAGIEDVAFDAATISRDASGDGWSYALDMSYSSASGASRSITLELQHAVTDRDAGLFEGLLTYAIEDEYTDRHCRDQPNGDVTRNGSVHYIKSGASALVLQARTATACGFASVSPAADLLVDPIASSVLSGNAVDPSAGWADDFAVFTAELDPATQLGTYAYSWQAGVGDSHTRVLEVGLETDAGGEAYFGFGEPVQSSLGGQIRGFLCNWAGPGNNHGTPEFARYAQRQALSKDSSTGRFVASDASASDITYAPTNSCMYDGAGSFVYDRDVDGDLADETLDTAAVSESGSSLAFDLMTVSEGEASIWDHIQARGYDLPSYP